MTHHKQDTQRAVVVGGRVTRAEMLAVQAAAAALSTSVSDLVRAAAVQAAMKILAEAGRPA